MKNFLEEETTMTEGRYSRQEMILGWDQKKWGSMSAVVIGDDLLGQQVLENLVATGLGDILFIGEKKNSAEKKGYYPNTSRDSMSDSAVDFLKKQMILKRRECFVHMQKKKGKFLFMALQKNIVGHLLLEKIKNIFLRCKNSRDHRVLFQV